MLYFLLDDARGDRSGDRGSPGQIAEKMELRAVLLAELEEQAKAEAEKAAEQAAIADLGQAAQGLLRGR